MKNQPGWALKNVFFLNPDTNTKNRNKNAM